MSIVWYTDELRALAGDFKRLAEWFERDSDTYDADALARDLEAKGLLDPESWEPKRWVMDAIVASRCQHERVLWADGGYRVALLCRDCGDVCYDGEFDGDVTRYREMYVSESDRLKTYPENCSIAPIHYALRSGITLVDLFVLGITNGSRDREHWAHYCSTMGAL